jgi:hypothetical protein
MVSGTAERDDYSYDGANRVTQIKAGASLTAPGALRSDFSYDLMGRMTLQHDYAANGTSVVYSDSRSLNAKGQVTSETVATVKGATTYTAVSTYDYGAGSSYALGSPLSVTTVNLENGVEKLTTLTSNGYLWADGPIQSYIWYKPDITKTATNTTTYAYDTIGGVQQLAQISIADGRPRTVTLRNDMLGQAFRRDELDANNSAGDPHEVWYRFSGRELGYVGNNGTIDTDEVPSINNRTANQGTGAFLNGANSGASFAARRRRALPPPASALSKSPASWAGKKRAWQRFSSAMSPSANSPKTPPGACENRVKTMAFEQAKARRM